MRLSNKLVSNKNNNNRSTFKKNNSNSKIYRFGINSNNIEYIKKIKSLKNEKLFKFQKLSKSKKLKNIKLFKSQNLAILKKKLSKSRNLANFSIKKARPNFLIPNTKKIFNFL